MRGLIGALVILGFTLFSMAAVYKKQVGRNFFKDLYKDLTWRNE